MHTEMITIITGIVVAVIIYFIAYPSVLYHGPNSNIVRKRIYKLDGKCYKLKPVVYICPIRTSMR